MIALWAVTLKANKKKEYTKSEDTEKNEKNRGPSYEPTEICFKGH